MKLKVEKVLYFESFIVVEPGLTTLKNSIDIEEALLKAQEKFGEDAFTAGIGAEAVRNSRKLRFKKRTENSRESLAEIKSKVTEERTIKRLKLINLSFHQVTNLSG